MQQLEVFFDYACPYCLRGHEYLMELLPKAPKTEILWRPCEAHPRPEVHGRYSDLCIQGMFFAQAQGADLLEYHRRMYKAAVQDRVDIEDIDVLTGVIDGFLDPEAFRKALREKIYEKVQLDSNLYAYEKNEVWVVPAFRMGGRKLDSIGGVGVTQEQLAEFIGAK